MANPKTSSSPRVARPRPRSESARPAAALPRSGASPAAENLDETYAHVRRDLRRIFLLGTLLLAGIYGSQYL